MPGAKLRLSGDPDADQLLSTDPLALLIGMVLDQQVPLERAFSAPRDLKERLDGALDAERLAVMDPAELAAIFSRRPALHRFPAANAKRVQQLCRVLVEEYRGRAADVWRTAETGDELLRRIRALPGFGEQKARIFVGLLAKQLAVAPPGWEVAAGPFGRPGTYLSVADITDDESLGRVRAHKQQAKAAAKEVAGRGPGPSPAAAPGGRPSPGAGPGGRSSARPGLTASPSTGPGPSVRPPPGPGRPRRPPAPPAGS